jgi:hypothetical protein
MDDFAVGTVVARLAGWLPRLMPDRARADALCDLLIERFAGRHDAITADAGAEIETTAWPLSRHLMLGFEPGGACSGGNWESCGVRPDRV